MSEATMSQPQWPPRSPHEALLSSPSGRDRLRRLRERGSPTPSPRKLPLQLPPSKSLSRRELEQRSHSHSAVDEEEECEDEETLQLQLQAIEARLKLKRLQQTKSKPTSSSGDGDKRRDEGSLSAGRTASTSQQSQTTESSGDGPPIPRKASGRHVEVPLSPPQRKAIVPNQRSPGRVLLGIDKGLKGRDVSLRKAPISRAADLAHKALARSTGDQTQVNGSRESSGTQQRSSVPGLERPKSFSEKIAESRASDRQRQEREDRTKKARSAGFGVDSKELEGFKTQTLSKSLDDPFLAEAKYSRPHEYTRDEILRSSGQVESNSSQRTTSITSSQPSVPRASQSRNTSTATTTSDSPASGRPTPSASGLSGTAKSQVGGGKKAGSGSGPVNHDGFESFSGLHLSKRILPHAFLTRTFAGKHTCSLAKLLKEVKAPTFDPPDVEGDWLLLGVIAAKSNPLNHKNSKANVEGDSENGRGKFMALTLTDLKWEVDLFLFASAFERFWRLTPGTVVAILNPSIMPPAAGKQDTGKFSLTLHSSDDTILEIGTARDLGFCKTVKKNGQLCSQWLDKRHTEYCAFHVDITVKKTMAGRMEVNTMGRLFDPKQKQKQKRVTGPSRDWSQQPKPHTTDWSAQGGRQSAETKARYFVAPSISGGPRQSAAKLLDDDDVDPDHFHRGSTREERMRRRLAEREREREIGRKLGDVGNGMGGAYLRASHGEGSGNQGAAAGSSNAEDAVDAESLGLIGGMASSVSLSPIKRKRVQSGTPQDTGMGWGSAYKTGIPQSVVKKKQDEPDEPAKKKTRFITAKGIREAGRDSFGQPSPARAADRVEDDDGLEIV